jgi:hypothetical protein
MMAQISAIKKISCFLLIALCFLVAHPASAQVDDGDRLMVCTKSGGVYQQGKCFSPVQFKNVTQKRLAEVEARQEQARRMACAGVKDPCSMPMCKTPGIKCPDPLKDIAKLIPPTNIPKRSDGTPIMANGMPNMTPLKLPPDTAPLSPANPAPPGGVFPPQVSSPVIPQPVAKAPPVYTQPVPGVTTNSQQTSPPPVANQTTSRSATQPKPVSNEAPKDAGGLPSWMRFGN